MSLINSTLKDLDKRREKESVKKRSFLTEVLLSAGRHKKFRIPGFIQFGIVMSLMVALGVVLWSQYEDTILLQYDEYISSLMGSETPDVKLATRPVPVMVSKKESVPSITPTVEQERPSDVKQADASQGKADGEKVAVNTRQQAPAKKKPVERQSREDSFPWERKKKARLEKSVSTSARTATIKTAKPIPVSRPKESGKVAKKVHPQTRKKRAELGIEKALGLIKKGSYTEAEKQLRRALWLYSDSLRAREILAMLLINQGRVSEAAKLLVESLDIAPYHSPFAKLYARILVNQGETSRAIVILEQAQPDIMENPEYHSFLAALYQKLFMHERAIGKYRQVLSLRPDVGAWWLGLAISLEGKGQVADAIAAYRTARKSSNLNDNIIAYINGRLNILSES